MVVLITAGQRHEQTMFEPLMEREAVKRRRRGRPWFRPERVAGDKGYSGRRIRRYLRRRGIGAVIARQNRERRTRFDKPRTARGRSSNHQQNIARPRAVLAFHQVCHVGALGRSEEGER
jgi:hypothetical protein